MATRKRSTSTKSSTKKAPARRKPSNSRPRKVRHENGPSVRQIVERAEAEAPGFQRNPSWGHYSYLTALLGRVSKSAFGGFAAPRNADEANVQIRTMAGVAFTATNEQSAKQIEKVVKSGSAKPPIPTSEKLTELAAKLAVADLD